MDSKMNKLQMSRLRKMFEDGSLANELKQMTQCALGDDFEGYDEEQAENDFAQSAMKISEETYDAADGCD